MPRRLAAIAIVNILVFLVLAEVAGLLVYYVQHGTLFYSERQAFPAASEEQARRVTAEGIHPYFGPTHKRGQEFNVPEALRDPRVARPGAPARTNNFGFVSRFDYPYVKTSNDQFIVGILGGSVGVWFCEVGANYFLERLKQDASFRHRVLIPLCLSHEGYKQPQQLQVLSYFLSIGQEFDLVVNIDGFNEVALSTLNDRAGLDISMPSVLHLDPLVNLVNQGTLTREKIQSLARIDDYKTRLTRLSTRLRGNRLASVHVALEQYYRRIANDYQVELVTFGTLPSNRSEDSLVEVTPPLRERPGSSLLQEIAGNWARSSVLINEMLRGHRTAYFHFLQPNQYYTTRTFSEAEARVALNAQSPFKAGAAAGYPFLLTASESFLKARDVNFHNGVGIFDGESAPVYIDDCCHYTLRGNQILADFMAQAVLRAGT
jgi:hypothetical protein